MHLYSAFSTGTCSKAFLTMISLPPADRKHISWRMSPLALISWNDGLKRERRPPKYSNLDRPGPAGVEPIFQINLSIRTGNFPLDWNSKSLGYMEQVVSYFLSLSRSNDVLLKWGGRRDPILDMMEMCIVILRVKMWIVVTLSVSDKKY